MHLFMRGFFFLRIHCEAMVYHHAIGVYIIKAELCITKSVADGGEARSREEKVWIKVLRAVKIALTNGSLYSKIMV